MLTVDRRFALSNPAFVSKPAKNIVGGRQFPYLCVELSHGNRWWRIRPTIAENPSCPFEELIPPGLDDIRVDIEFRGQLGQHLLALNSGKRHLCLESRAMVPAWSSRHGISCSRHQAAVRQKIHLSQLSRFSVPALGYIQGGTSPQAFLFRFFAFQIPNCTFLKDPSVLRVMSSSDLLPFHKVGSHTRRLRFFPHQKCYICLQ